MISALGEIAGTLRLGASQGASPVNLQATAKAAAAPAASAGADFAATLKDVAGEALNTIKGGEVAATLGMRGQMATQDVVQAVIAAEQTLQAVVAIRDKAVAAYQEITRMSI